MAFLSEIYQKLNASRINLSNLPKPQMELKFKDDCSDINLRAYMNLSRLVVNISWRRS